VRVLIGTIAAALVVLASAWSADAAVQSLAQASPRCADYSTQAAAQRAADTRDSDGDGVYCESLPCPCAQAAPGSGGSTESAPAKRRTTPTRRSCVKPRGVQNISLSKTKYPNIRRHYLQAIADGWPRTLVVNRAGGDARRDRLLEGHATRPGMDRDEYPPAVGRGKGKGLTRGVDPRGWRASLAYVPSGENRSHGATLGLKLRRFCTWTRFRYVFY
jgi:hypothetical protein